jgi:cytochrome b involved in lipid metabolism
MSSDSSTSTSSSTSSSVPSVGSRVLDPTIPYQSYSFSTISVHNTYLTCWLILDGFVFDVTNFLFSHPGGALVLMDRAGQDASDVFQSAAHSWNARRTLKDYLIGEVENFKEHKILPWASEKEQKNSEHAFVRVEREI